MRKSVQLFVLSLLCVGLLFISNNCLAGIEPNQNSLTGPFTAGTSTYTAQDSKFTDPNWSTYTTKSIKTTVGLKVLDNVLISSNFSYTVNLQIQYYTSPTSSVTTVNTSLTVNYATGQGAKYKGLDIYNLTSAYKVVVLVTGVSSTGTVPTSAVQLNTGIYIDRLYPMTATASIGATYTIANNTKQLVLNWATTPSADEYDVEWTTINDGNANFSVISANASATYDNPTLDAALLQAFRNNASRITTRANTITLSMLSTDSIMLVRVRQAQYNPVSGVRITGNWDYRKGTGYAIWRLQWDEQSQNWQYSAAFAEDGKKKEVITYFDGTLRGRQTVTLNNTDNVAIAQENVYDYFGRPTASILPAPYKELSLTPYLHYIPGFNINKVDSAYNYANVLGAAPAACEFNPDSLSTNAGASRYYSTNNDFKTLNLDNYYIPDAAGFPLSVTQYTADNTGRIQSQGGVGPAFQPGKPGPPLASNTTKYYYGKPEQWELDQLFANDAGYAEHYLKNMVVDPNGQVSISFLNASGKTVATALTGQAPSMLDTLPSYHSVTGGTKPQHLHLLKPSQFTYSSSALTLSATTTYMASVTGTDTLKFSIKKLVDTYPGGAFTICSNCYYKMTALVSDDCGNIAASITTPVKIGDTVGTCGDTSLYNGTLVVPVTAIGSYNVNIQLAFDNTIIQNYASTFIDSAISKHYMQDQFDYIKQRYLDSLNVTGCFSDCHTCETLLNSQATFVAAVTNEALAMGLDTASVESSLFSTWANGLYTNLKDSCNALQANCNYSPCETAENEMLDDVSPGGQYAVFDVNGNPTEPSINVITETLPGSSYQNWRVVFPVLPASNATYKKNAFILPDSTTFSPNDVNFTIQDLIAYWQPGWASYFLKYDPEYCKLRFCDTTSTYQSWDQRVQQDFTTAAQVPNIPTPSGVPARSYSYTNASDWLLPADPFFATGGLGHSYYTAMDNDLLNFSKNVLDVPGTSHIKGLMAYDDYILYCQNKTGNMNTGTPADSTWSDCVPVTSCRDTNREWALYSQYYFQAKQKYYQLLQNSMGLCPTDSCTVGQPVTIVLPSTTVCPLPSDFSVQAYTGTPTCTGKQTAVIVHNSGTLSQSVTVVPYYPPIYTDAGLVRSVVLNAGVSQQTFCVPDDIPISAISVSSAYCSSSYPYGNDSTWVVHFSDVAGGTLHNDCGNHTFTIRTTKILLEDSHGNLVNAVGPVSVRYKSSYVGSCTDTTLVDTSSMFLTIPIGQDSAVSVYPSFVSCDIFCHWSHKVTISCISALTGASNITGNSTCTGFKPTNPQPSDGRCAALSTKVSRFPQYTNVTPGPASGITNGSQLTTPMLAQIKQQGADICTANATNWMAVLQHGLARLHATSTQITNLTNAFIAICSASADTTHPMGATTLPPGQTLPYVSFGAAITSLITELPSGHYTADVNPWLINTPYPYAPPMQAASKTISTADTAICNLFSSLKAKATTAGKTLYNYLVSTYGSAMTLSQSQLDTLQSACINCRFILQSDITLPVFLDAGNTGCVLRSAYTTAKAALETAFNDTLTTTTLNYQTILANYMNQQWGFTLAYSDYANFEAGTAPQLCNSPAFADTTADPYSCMENTLAQAIANGLADYTNYLATQKQLFISSYTNTCSLAQANVNLTAVQQEYHYTLYYYDQADNLVRTVPPEGVNLVDTGMFSYIDKARDLDTAAYSYTYNGPTTASSETTAMTALSGILQSTGSTAIEMWLYNGGANHDHWVGVTPDNKYLFQVGLTSKQLNIDIYPTSAPSSTSFEFNVASRSFQCSLPAEPPLFPFSHVVIQGTNLGGGTTTPSIYLNGKALTVTTISAQPPFGFTVTGNSSSVTLPDSIQNLKHLRLYTHLLTTPVITADASDQFFNAHDLAYTGWYRFNVPAPGAPPTTINSTTSNETAIYDQYPSHVIPTSYAYNATNQVNTQLSPDGGTNRYWYDLLSRLVISQNDKQLPANNYSYTVYDSIGRITEVGQKNYTGTSIGSPDYLQNATIQTFNTSGTNSQVTDTYYDSPVATIAGHTNGIATVTQSNLRKRVAASTYTETQGSAALRATYYNYDIDGNVKTLWQQLDGLYVPSTNAGLKRIDYEYDLVSGKVNFVRYQDTQPDAYYYSYAYDADNRLTGAWSGVNDLTDTLTHSYLPTITKKQDAQYYYYLHGPLRRMELGDSLSKVQGIDYAYTLQGWLKGVNSSNVQSSKDMGRDSLTVAKDAYGYTLYYYGNGTTITDYKPIGGTYQFATNPPSFSNFYSLYNGNIAAMSTNVPQLTTNPWHYYTYRYDQLNRIKASHVYKVSSTPTSIADYHENFTYDGNGNIKTVSRYTSAATVMDSLTYTYNTSGGKLTNNKLNYITDAITTHIWPYSLANQAVNNYSYDAIGNITADVVDTISNINWTVYNKILNLTNSKGTISYTYNPAGERVSKTVSGVTTWYIRDAQGNPLALYTNAHSTTNWIEQDIYGSSRLGMWTPNENLTTANATAIWDTIGKKQYQLTNHLDNILATITDKRLQTASGTSVGAFSADIATAQEYYAFGGLMPGRTFDESSYYRYGFNGKENDNDVKGTGNQQDYGMRIYDPRVGRFLSVDPISKSYPMLSSYQFASDRPIDGIDRDGLEFESAINVVIGAYQRSDQPGFSDYLSSTWDVIKDNATDLKNSVKNAFVSASGAQLMANTYNDAAEYEKNIYQHGRNQGREYEQIKESGGDYNSVQYNYDAKQAVLKLKLIKDGVEWFGIASSGIEVSATGTIEMTVARETTLDALAGTLTNNEARQWYLSQEAKIPTLLSKDASLEVQAKEAFSLRNQFRTDARKLMSDRATAKYLMIEEPNMSWNEVVQKYSDQGYKGDDLYKKIIQSSQKSRESVNKKLNTQNGTTSN